MSDDAPLYPLDTAAQAPLRHSLQKVLWNTIELANQGKQAHWNVRGPLFKVVHEQLDEIVSTARDLSDEIAERIVTLGPAVDGRTSQVALQATLPPLPDGTLADSQAVRLIAGAVAETVRSIREELTAVGEVDPVSQDLLIGACADLEKHLWMLRSQMPV